MKVALITGDEPHYQLGLISGLADQEINLDVIGGDIFGREAIKDHKKVTFYGLREKLDPSSSAATRLFQVLRYYLRLFGYAARTDSKLFHIQWPYKFVFFDRTLLLIYYKLTGKKLVFTAHNIDRGARDGKQSWKNRVGLWCLYRATDHIIVHTQQMRQDLVRKFHVSDRKVTVIPHGINCAVPESSMDRADARRILGLSDDEPVLLFFGLIDRYKGLDTLVRAVASLKRKGTNIRLIVAGRIKECQDYWDEVMEIATHEQLGESLRLDLKYIPDGDVERYFKAADALVLPYRGIFQSGVLFMAYRFGLPVIATDVGAFREDIVEGQTGFICRPNDPADLAKAIQSFFSSKLHAFPAASRQTISRYAKEKYSWENIGRLTCAVYENTLNDSASME